MKALTPVTELPRRQSLVIVKRVAWCAQVAAYGYIGYRGLWPVLALMGLVGFAAHIETSAIDDIKRIDAAKRCGVEYDFTRGAE